MVTPSQLSLIMPSAGAKATLFAGPISAAAKRFQVNTPARLAAFLAQVGEESAFLTGVVENLNYTAAGLRATWPSLFDAATAAAYAHQPEKIANQAYASRLGNGDEASGDGWRFRGRGLIQITGRAGYAACATGLDLPLVEQPELLEQPDNAAASAAWFWQSRGLNALADAADFMEITRRINGGLGGIASREAIWARAKSVLGVPA